MIFPHELIRNGDIKMKEPDCRQKKKGIKDVIDLDCFKKDFPNLIFLNIEELVDFVKKNLY